MKNLLLIVPVIPTEPIWSLSDACTPIRSSCSGPLAPPAERREDVWRTSGWSAALARTPRRARRLCPHPPAPAATVLAYTPGDRTSPAPQANHEAIQKSNQDTNGGLPDSNKHYLFQLRTENTSRQDFQFILLPATSVARGKRLATFDQS